MKTWPLCAVCNEPVKNRRHKYCSRECCHASMRHDIPERYCQNCGDLLERNKGEKKHAFAKRKSCSTDCAMALRRMPPGKNRKYENPAETLRRNMKTAEAAYARHRAGGEHYATWTPAERAYVFEQMRLSLEQPS